MRKYITLFFVVFGAMAHAQNPAPAKMPQGRILILNGTAHLGNGMMIPNSAIAFENGKLTLVADARTIKINRDAYSKIIDAGGKQVYPGFIDCNSGLGLTEIDMVRSTNDNNEVGELNPNVRSIIAYNTDSKIPPTVRSNGVLLEQIVPNGGIISGQSSIVQLDAWNWEDAAYKTDDGIHVNWPRMYISRYPKADPEDVQRQKMTKALNDLDLFFGEAKAYCQNSVPAEKNLKLEAMRGLFDGKKNLYVHCDYVREMVSAIDFAKKYSLKLVIVGGADSYLITDLLRDNHVSIILGRTHSLPSREDDDVALPFKLPSILQKAGVMYTMSIESSWQSRNLGFMAGTGAGFGLTQEEAIKAITLNAATILGIDSTAGSLETGKDATFFISSGDALDMRTQNVESAYICGREIDLDDVQKQLYRKYLTKYNLKP